MSTAGRNDRGMADILNIDRLMEALARRKTPRINKESLSLEIAFEIREVAPDSKLLVGVPLDQGEGKIEVDILGLVNGRKLAVRISNGAGSRVDCLKALADVQELCAVEPDLTGLALAIVPGREAPEDIGEPWPTWRSLATAAGNEGAEVKYAYAWATPPAAP